MSRGLELCNSFAFAACTHQKRCLEHNNFRGAAEVLQSAMLGTVPPTTAGRRTAWVSSKEGLETQARPSLISSGSSFESADATRPATPRLLRPARDIEPFPLTGSLTPAGAGAMALKHTQDKPVLQRREGRAALEKAARRAGVVTAMPALCRSGAALLRNPDSRLSLFETWQDGTLTQAGHCLAVLNRRVPAATAIAAGWRGFIARWGKGIARYNFYVARLNVRCEERARARPSRQPKGWLDAALRSHNATHHGTTDEHTTARQMAYCSVRTLLPWHASTTPQALQTKADGRPPKAAAPHRGSVTTFFRAQSVLLNKQVKTVKQVVSAPVRASRRWSI